MPEVTSDAQSINVDKNQDFGLPTQSAPLQFNADLQVDRTTFPYPADMQRLNAYDFYERLFEGQHFTAFAIKVENELYGKNYGQMRYIVANFPGLISKVVADLLFIEPPKIVAKDGDQEFIDGLVNENKLRVTNYESALMNSYMGDNLYKLRVGPRDKDDTEASVIIEEVTPKIYFPHLDPFNVKGDPDCIELAWSFKIGDKSYLRKEIHEAGTITNEVYLLEANKITTRMPISILGPDFVDVEQTEIDEPLVVHVANWRAGNSHFGKSDYYDLQTLFYAINNRLTKIDAILDKHSDPILALPDGVVDEDGKIRRNKLGLFVRPENSSGTTDDPQYITWDAKLESAYSEIDHLLDMTYIMSEISPDVLGMGQGQSDSGRALKFKLIRTLAKVQRKQLYYREALIDVLLIAQKLAKAHHIKINGKEMVGDPVRVEIVWDDGLPKDLTEATVNEVARVGAGLSTKVASIMRLDDVDEDTAKMQVKEIQAQNKVDVPKMTITPQDFGNKPGDGNGNLPVKPPVKTPPVPAK